MTKNPQVLISSREAADILGVDTRTVQRRADAGELPFVSKMPGLRGAYIFNRPVIEAHIRLASPEDVSTPEAPAPTGPPSVGAGASSRTDAA